MSEASLTIVHLSDLHFGAITPGAPEAAVEAVRRIGPGLVIVSGDLTLRGTAREFGEAGAFLEALGVGPERLVCVPGNHDVPAYGQAERFARPLRRYRACVAGRAVEAYDDGRVAVLGLNSARAFGLHWNWAHGRVSGGQVEHARRWFAERRDRAFKALVVHHPPRLFGPNPGFRPLGRGARLLSALAGGGVDAVLTGHLHRPAWVLPERAGEPIHLQSGTALSSRVRGPANCFDQIDVGDGEVVLTRWELRSGAFVPDPPRAVMLGRGGGAGR